MGNVGSICNECGVMSLEPFGVYFELLWSFWRLQGLLNYGSYHVLALSEFCVIYVEKVDIRKVSRTLNITPLVANTPFNWFRYRNITDIPST